MIRFMMMHDPHSFLGLHSTPQGQIIRLFRPGSETVYLDVLGTIVEAMNNGDGIFTFTSSKKLQNTDYRVYHHSGLLAHDPYAFLPTIGEMDLFLFNKGCHYELYRILGANAGVFHGVKGVRFAVWAPNAAFVCLIGDFNHFHGNMNPMRSMGVSGIWELFVPGIEEGEKYKFEIQTKEGYSRTKSDPFAFY
jgi:1,4-alpha-glucan branching enzyme